MKLYLNDRLRNKAENLIFCVQAEKLLLHQRSTEHPVCLKPDNFLPADACCYDLQCWLLCCHHLWPGTGPSHLFPCRCIQGSLYQLLLIWFLDCHNAALRVHFRCLFHSSDFFKVSSWWGALETLMTQVCACKVCSWLWRPQCLSVGSSLFFLASLIYILFFHWKAEGNTGRMLMLNLCLKRIGSEVEQKLCSVIDLVYLMNYWTKWSSSQWKDANSTNVIFLICKLRLYMSSDRPHTFMWVVADGSRHHTHTGVEAQVEALNNFWSLLRCPHYGLPMLHFFARSSKIKLEVHCLHSLTERQPCIFSLRQFMS